MNKLITILFILFSRNTLSQTTSHSGLSTKNISTQNTFNSKKTFGHNMSPNSYTLNKGDCTVGPYAAACGVTDDLTLGSSTWLYWNYNMYSVFFRAGHRFNSEWRASIQSAYLKTFDVGKYLGYVMESSRSHFTLSRKHSSGITVHYNLTYEYFLDETLPHSMRREPLKNDPSQVSATALLEYEASKDYLLHYETGIHGVNYHYPQLLVGFSGGRKFKNSFLQIGVSMTGTPKAYFTSNRFDSSRVNERTKQYMKYDFSVHPEFQWQYVF
jgi:hypothetical protein